MASRETATTMVGNVYLGRVQNVLPSMEAAFVDIGKGRNAVPTPVRSTGTPLAWRAIRPGSRTLSSGDTVLVQVKDPIGHKARLTSRSPAGPVPGLRADGSMTGISRKLPDTERAPEVDPQEIVPDTPASSCARPKGAEESCACRRRAAHQGLGEDQPAKAEASKPKGRFGCSRSAADPHGPGHPRHLHRGLQPRRLGDRLVEVSDYVEDVAPGPLRRLTDVDRADLLPTTGCRSRSPRRWTAKVWLPSGGSLVIDRTEAMTVVDVNTGKFVGSGGNPRRRSPRTTIEAAGEIVRQLRLRDIGGIIVIDFIDMVLESNRDLVVRRLRRCLGGTAPAPGRRGHLARPRADDPQAGRLRLIEVFSEAAALLGRGIIVHAEPIDKRGDSGPVPDPGRRRQRSRGACSWSVRMRAPTAVGEGSGTTVKPPASPAARPQQIAAAAHAQPDDGGSGPRRRQPGHPCGGGARVDGVEHVSSSIDEQRGSVDASEALGSHPPSRWTQAGPGVSRRRRHRR